MTCEICGTRCAVEPCAVCGIDMCHTCKGGRLGAEGCAITAADLCPEHYKQARDYIESLKPKTSVRWFDFAGCYSIASSGEYGSTTKISPEHANALYEYMKRERGG